MADEGRQRRVAERIRESVANTLERKVKDPRLGFVTVTDVRVTGDLQHATVFYTAMGDEVAQKKSRKALESAKGLIRSEVGAALGIRLTPTISFEQDALPETAASIEDALRTALKRDAEIAAAAQGKEYAGGASPYLSGEDDLTEDASDEDDLSGDSSDEGALDRVSAGDVAVAEELVVAEEVVDDILAEEIVVDNEDSEGRS